MQENTSFLCAAAMLGFAEDVMELGPIALKAEQVPVMKSEKANSTCREDLRGQVCPG